MLLVLRVLKSVWRNCSRPDLNAYEIMSHHILHILKHGCVLSKDRGFLVCRGEDKSENRIPHEDVRAGMQTP